MLMVNANSISQLRGVNCHMGSHSFTGHPTQVNTPRGLGRARSAAKHFDAVYTATQPEYTKRERDDHAGRAEVVG